MRRLLLLVLFAIVASACATDAGTSELGYIPGEGATVIPAEQREPAPPVAGQGIDGEPLTLANYRGMPVVLNFWASWCGPCATEAPQIQTVADQYGGRAQVLGVDIQDTVPSARTFERDLGIRYPSFFDPSVEIAARFRGVAPQALPTTLVLDADHRVAVQHFGAVSAVELRAYLDAVLGERASG
jgi:thiol-disulfide isomerase/thioredoxin